VRYQFKLNEFRGSTQNLPFIYFIALSVIAVSAIVSQLLVQTHLDSQKNDARIINIAGRQRMLSQKISKLALRAKIMYSPPLETTELTMLIANIQQAQKLWQKSQLALLEGSEEMGVSPQNSPKIIQMFQEITPHYQAMLRTITDFLEILQMNDLSSSNVTALNHILDRLLNHEQSFLTQMDQIVFQYDLEATERLQSLRVIELLLFGITVGVLILELFFIFLPQAKQLHLSYNALKKSNDQANELAVEARALYEGVQKSNRELRNINYALDEAAIIVKTDLAGCIIEVGKKFCNVSGFSEEEILGKLFEITPFVEKTLPPINNSINEELIWRGEELKVRKDGSFYWLDITLVPITSTTGAPYQLLAICTDITLRKEQEELRFKKNQDKYEREIHAQRLRSLAIITGQEKERKRMAREVHDGLGQVLTALNFRLESLQVINEKEQKKLVETQHILMRAIREVRRISSGLLPVVLSDYGLAAGIKDLVQMSVRQTNIKILYENKFKLAHRLHRDVEVSLYRIAQESLNNALKYSQAQTIHITLESDAEFVTLSIVDDGLGFDLEQQLKEHKQDFSGNGLASIKERSNLIGGQLLISTSPGQGTNIYLEVPLTPENYEQNKSVIS